LSSYHLLAVLFFILEPLPRDSGHYRGHAAGHDMHICSRPYA